MPEETLRWFRGSKVVNGDGSPKVVYHGTQETFEAFEAGEFGFHFGDEEASGLHAGLDGPTRYLIKIKRPLRMKDLGVWYPHDAIREVVKVLNLPMKKANKALEDTDRLGELLAGQIDQDEDFIMNRRAFYKWSTPAREFIKSLGYDGIVYRNEAEGFNDSYIVFENDQIRRLPG